MIYTIFLYQSHTGLLIYDKSFQEEDTQKAEMFSSFLSAMKSFVSELILEGSKELKNIELGDYSVLITGIPLLKVDLVIITDKEDLKSVNKLIPKLIKLLQKYEELFLSWDGDRNAFEILDKPLATLLVENIKDFRKSSLIEPKLALKSIWAKSKHLTEEERNAVIQERDMLIYKMENTPILPKKVNIAEEVIKLSDQLRDEDTYIRFQEELSKLKKEIDDTKFKLNYYLERIRSTLNEALENIGDKPTQMGDFKNTYLNLYSFGSKLKLLKGNGAEIYKKLANKLIEKDSLSEHELAEVIETILKMSPNVDDYFSS
ncbi:MAG: hypothetical protein EAX89_03065 [Candidatus Lokiarchaeota archaeon]|nr:hypothetical protein [Candidatus Lokiarchaeota archaeon]